MEMVRFASQREIYTATSTNAHYLNDEAAKETVESGLDRLIISLMELPRKLINRIELAESLIR